MPSWPKNDRQVRKVLRKNDCEWEECRGSHRKAQLPTKDVIVWHNHGEFGKGLACKLGKALAAAGFLVFIFFCALISPLGDFIAALIWGV